MLTSKDLMIGDWVLTLDPTHEEKVQAQIWAIEEGQTSILVKKDITNWFVDIEWIEPIPLNPEILEKNGFEYNEHPFVQGWEQFGLTLYHGGDGYRVNCGQNVALQLDSVHQLQHALRLCGIEKEITI